LFGFEDAVVDKLFIVLQARSWVSAEIFPGKRQHRHFTYSFSGCERYSVNGPSQSASPYLHHKENSPSFYSFC